jgi:hypothetical protein
MAVILLAVLSGPAGAATTWFDDFSDGNAEDGNPLTWSPHPALSGDYNATSGDYIFTPPGSEAMAASVEDAVFSGVSVRVRARTVMNGNVGMIGRLDFTTVSGYTGFIDAGGTLFLDRVTGGQADPEFDLEQATELSALEDVVVQLDIFGDTISLSAWRPGDPQPAPQLSGTDSAFASGTAGLVFLEDEAFASGEFRWATAASSRIINGDVNFDGDVNGLDVDPFVTAVLGGDYSAPADMNGDGSVDGLDVDPFVAAVVGGGVQQIPEPSTLLLAALGLLGLLVHARQRSPA